jgi:pimeloyl-ACP methyl ester carboxylesterase
LPAEVDFIEQGTGPQVVLLHSSVAGARQWRALMQDLSGTYQMRALNLHGYGSTPEWSGPGSQRLQDQAELLHGVLPDPETRFAIVGHSFGGSVAMKAAALFQGRVDRLVLIEPNPFYLLAMAGRDEAFAEAAALCDCIKRHGAAGTWSEAAAVFADYWTGAGSWDAMPEERQVKFARALRPNFHEWDAVLTETAPLSTWRACLPAKTTVIHSKDTVRSIREIVDLLAEACPEWHFETLSQGGHMAAVTRPEIMNPYIRRALA